MTSAVLKSLSVDQLLLVKKLKRSYAECSIMELEFPKVVLSKPTITKIDEDIDMAFYAYNKRLILLDLIGC